MIDLLIEVPNKTGLHARPANLFVKTAKKYLCDITISKENDEKSYNAKSIFSVISMAAVKGTRIVVHADGPDEADAIREIEQLVDDNFGETEHSI